MYKMWVSICGTINVCLCMQWMEYALEVSGRFRRQAPDQTPNECAIHRDTAGQGKIARERVEGTT